MTRFLILSAEQTIGTTDLEMHDPGMNIYSGRFYPTLEYFIIRAVFRSFGHALDRMDDERENAVNDYYIQRDSLRLSIRHTDLRPLSANWINIIDLDDDLNCLDGLRVEIALDEVASDPS